MKKSGSAAGLVVAAIVFSSCMDDPVLPQSDLNPQFSQAADGRYIIELRGSDVAGLSAAVATLGGNLEFAHADAGIATVSGLTPVGAAELARANSVAAVHEDIEVQLTQEAEAMGATQGATVLSANPATALLYSWQWNMRRIGADVAWAAGRLGSSDVTVAIIDSGIDTENLDLAGRVDLTRSRSFVPDDDAFMNTWLPTRPKIEDLHGHGTLIASQVASNALFFAGVTSRVRLLAIKTLDRELTGFLSAHLLGVLYAADQGADVANMSLRRRGGLDKRNPFSLFPVTNRVFNYAYRKGMVVVVIPGNEAEDMDNDGLNFRAYCEAPHVICVSATGPTASTHPLFGPWQNEDALASYSNYGKAITLSAPGGTRQGLISAVCARRAVTGFVPNTNPAVPIFGCLTPTPNSAFIFASFGTSLAAPHVAGLAALLVEDLGKNNPSAIKNALLRGVDDLGEPGPDPLFGAGRINIPKALGLQ
jgi:subtilisin family serine protease